MAGLRAARDIQLFQFQVGNRWSSTATNPGPLGQGDPTTIRWSIVPDGTFIPGSNGEPDSASILIAHFNAIYGNQATWRALMQQSFDRWGQLTGNTYVFEPNDDGGAFPSVLTQSPGAPGVVGVRGDVRIGGHPIDGNSGILAYNFFPDIGDMVVDVPDSFYSNTGSNSLRLRNTVAHEHGHGLGFSHVCPINQTKLMEPFLTLGFDGPQHDDTLAGQRGYGDDKETNDTLGAATDLGSLGNGSVSVNGVSADDNSDVDRYRFTVAAGKKVSATVTPVGFSYLEGPQNMNGSCSAGTSFNSLTLNDVGFQLIGTDGTTVLATANAQPAGAAEALSDVVLGAAGTYSLRVFAGGNNQVQLYNLALTVADASANLAITKTDGKTTVLAGSMTTYTIVASNAGPSAVTNATVVDTFPAAITSVSWTCAASPGSSCATASGTANINHTVNLAVGGTATFTAMATLSASATGTLSNTATVSSSLADLVPGNNSATDVNTIVPVAFVSATKSISGTFEAGGAVSYSVVLTNSGGAVQGNNPGHEFTDTLPAELALVSAMATSGTAASVGNTVTWNGSLAVSGSVTITINATINAGTEGDVVSNQGTVNYDADGNGSNETSALTDDPGQPGASNPTILFVGSGAVDFFTLPPCRMLDTRDPAGALGGPALIAQFDRTFLVAGTCGIPATAKAISVNLAVTQPTSPGNLRLRPGGMPVPLVSSINYIAGQTRSNNAVVPLNASGQLAVFCGQASGTVHFILDVNGYFE